MPTASLMRHYISIVDPYTGITHHLLIDQAYDRALSLTTFLIVIEYESLRQLTKAGGGGVITNHPMT